MKHEKEREYMGCERREKQDIEESKRRTSEHFGRRLGEEDKEDKRGALEKVKDERGRSNVRNRMKDAAGKM